jgi:hypothetical protein
VTFWAFLCASFSVPNGFVGPVSNPYFVPEVIRGMVVPFNSVAGTRFEPDGSYIIDDFAPVLSISGVPPNSTSWVKVSGPASGALQVRAPSESAQYVSPKMGGVYKFSATSCGVTTGLNLILPLAGAEVLPWLKSEVPLV